MFNREHLFSPVLVAALTARRVVEDVVLLGGVAPEAVGQCSETETRPERVPSRPGRVVLPRCEQRQHFATVSAVRAGNPR